MFSACNKRGLSIDWPLYTNAPYNISAFHTHTQENDSFLISNHHQLWIKSTYLSRYLVCVESFNESRGPFDSLWWWGESLSDDGHLVWVDHLLPSVAHTSTFLWHMLQTFKILKKKKKRKEICIWLDTKSTRQCLSQTTFFLTHTSALSRFEKKWKPAHNNPMWAEH